MLQAALPDLEIQAPKAVSYQQNQEGENVVHYVALPDGRTTIDPVDFPKEPLLSYEYELDEFQKTAVACVHRQESVLVSAHTSAGKTAIALYAIQEAISRNSRVIYTSPIKALSNQKYRELKEQFGDVGLITGDVSTNQSAPILVMTTEILRMMLYRGDSLIRELAWVIYDEIHYMRDPERGVVWEESIIMLPDAVKFVFLSATIPNAREFSEWISSIHHQPCHVVYTDHRPTPLKYYLSSSGSEMPTLIRDDDGPLNESAISATYAQIKPATSKHRSVTVQKLPESEATKPDRKMGDKLVTDTAAFLVEHDMGPLIVFAFGRKLCDELPEKLEGKKFTTDEESEQIAALVDVAIEKLDESDKSLPQIGSLRNLLVRGIGVHHGGLIPLLKELVELLFQHGLVRILFATETFAMGLNMPARTVVFHSLTKFDGDKRRLLSGGEFIQMSGRAGRRSHDTFGAVVIAATGDPPQDALIQLLKSGAQPLNSEFHVTYHMLLSLLCTRLMEPESLMKQSFHQFQMEAALPELEDRRQQKLKEAAAVVVPGEDRVKKLFDIETMLKTYNEDKMKILRGRDNMLALITPGKVIKVGSWGWGIVISPPRKHFTDFIALLPALPDIEKAFKPVKSFDGAMTYYFTIDITDVTGISAAKIDVRDVSTADGVNAAFLHLKRCIDSGIRPIQESALIGNDKDKEKFMALQKRIELLERTLPQFEDIPESVRMLYRKKAGIADIIKNLDNQIAYIKKAVMHRDLKEMRDIIMRLGLVDQEGIITDKGRVASVITAGDELVMTEMLFDGVLTDLTPQQVAALMCVFATDEGSNEEPDIPEEMEGPWTALSSIIDRVYDVMKECGRIEDHDKYTAKFDPVYMRLTYNWAAGASFSDVMSDNPDFFEGGVIRTMKRTEEILKQAVRAAKAMGNSDLETKISDAIAAIKRDIIFAASLYL